jgi:hypothetical protein
MKRNKKIITVLGLFVLLISGFAFTKPPKGEHKNLKVFPKNISHKDLDMVMDEFKAALGVKCDFCHVKMKDNPSKWDFASDEKPEKDISRKMMKMTERINKKFFNHDVTYAPAEALSVSCKTCHNGTPRPENIKRK